MTRNTVPDLSQCHVMRVVRILGESDDGQIVNEWAPLGSMILGMAFGQAGTWASLVETSCMVGPYLTARAVLRRRWL